MNEQFYKNLLGLLNRANKENRLKQAKKAGYDTVEGYKTSLQETISSFPVDKVSTTKKADANLGTFKGELNKPIIHNVYIIDTSRSMRGSKLTSALFGINKEIAVLKGETSSNYIQTIVEFNSWHNINTVVAALPVDRVGHVYLVARGFTALYQAIGETLDSLLAKDTASDKILVKIFTDGAENASTGKYHNPKILSKLIKDCEDRNFTITFVGVETDVKSIIKTLEIDISNTLSHNNTYEGIAESFEVSTNSTLNYSTRVNKGEDVTRGFYKEVGTL